MIIDSDLVFTQNSSGGFAPVPVTATAGSARVVSSATCSKTLDFLKGGDALGGNELTLMLVQQGLATVTSGGAAVKVEWETCPDSSFAASNTKVAAETPYVPVVPNGGTLYRMKPLDGIDRYNRAQVYVSAGASSSVASATSGVTPGVNVFLTKEQ